MSMAPFSTGSSRCSSTVGLGLRLLYDSQCVRLVFFAGLITEAGAGAQVTSAAKAAPCSETTRTLSAPIANGLMCTQPCSLILRRVYLSCYVFRRGIERNRPMYDKSDPRSALATAKRDTSGSTTTPASYGLYYHDDPADDDATGRAWYTRSQNLIVNYI